ncbi:MAG: DUF4340 domain-containing protein [Flavobacteriales bacterium]|nr:DUF4340 domain-containing protein [Flavobacteriales bacterium]
MFNRIGIRALVVVVAVLLLLFLLAHFFSLRSSERSFRSIVYEVDTATVITLRLEPRNTRHREVVLQRAPDGWKVSYDNGTFLADTAQMHRMLASFRQLRSKRYVGQLSQVDERYDLVDTLENRITITTVDGTNTLLHLGRSTYAPGDIGAWTYVNRDGEREVYAVEGLLSNLVDQAPPEWRPHHLVMGDPANWRSVTFIYPQDSGYVFERTPEGWTMNGSQVDTTRVSRFMLSLSRSRAQQFADDRSVEGLVPLYQVKVDDRTRPEPILVRAYPAGDTFLITSTANPGVLMAFDPRQEFPRLFRPRGFWF